MKDSMGMWQQGKLLIAQVITWADRQWLGCRAGKQTWWLTGSVRHLAVGQTKWWHFFLLFLYLYDSLDSDLLPGTIQVTVMEVRIVMDTLNQSSPPFVPWHLSLPRLLLLCGNGAHIVWEFSMYSERDACGSKHFGVRFNCVASVKFAFMYTLLYFPYRWMCVTCI